MQPITTQIVPKAKTTRKKDPPEDTLKRKRTEPSTKKLSPSSAKRQKSDVSRPPKSPKNSVKAPVKTILKTRKEEKRPSVHGSDGDAGSDDEEDDPALEDRYLRRTSALKKVPAPQSNSPSEEDANTNSDVSSDNDDDEEKEDDSASEDEDYDVNAPPPRHETQTRTRKKKTKKAKYIPPDESPAQRDARTVFIGNVSIDIVKSRVRTTLSIILKIFMLTLIIIACSKTAQTIHPSIGSSGKDRVNSFPFDCFFSAYEFFEGRKETGRIY